MSRTGYRTPRRTRVYDCNYNAGESYYKSALDDLDRKQKGPSISIADRLSGGRAKSFDVLDGGLEDSLSSARRRADKAIREDGILDTRNARFAKINHDIEDDFDNEIQSSLNRIRANKKNVSNVMNDLDLEDTVTSVKRKARIDFGEKLESLNDDFSSSFRQRSDKARADFNSIIDSTSLPAIEDFKSAASHRALASKARLDDLESEMFERSEKQAARDKRSAHLKKFLADNEFDSEATTQSIRSVTARAEKKIVSF